MSVLGVSVRVGWKVPLSLLSVGCRAGPGQAGTALLQSRNQHQSVMETLEGPRNPDHHESGPLTNSSVWMASSHEVLTSRPSVGEHVEPA